MARANSTAQTATEQSPVGKKPKPDFPLTWHPRGGWSKKVGGKQFYFGKDADQALKRWLHDKPYRMAGKVPPAVASVADYLTVEQLCNQFLAFKESMVAAGELSQRAFGDYLRVCKQLRRQFGGERAVEHLQPSDFTDLRAELGKTLCNASVGNEINRMRVVFKWAVDNGLLAKPIRYGQGFSRPKAKTLRLDRAAKGPSVYTREEYLKLINAADVQFRAMVLLAINTGMGPADIGLTKLSDIDLVGGWLRSFRNKTGIGRAAWLWPETRAALAEWITKRNAWLQRRKTPLASPEVAELLFITKPGACWHKESRGTPISHEFAKLLKKADVFARKGVSFYSLRRCVETYGGECRDQVAVNFVMGHVDASMGGIYRQGISDARVKAVCEAVRSWLFGESVEG